MKTSFHTLVPLALLFAVGATAQVQTSTVDTRPSYAGSAITFNSNGTLGEAFNNVSAIKSMTYDFFAGTGGNTSSTQLSAVFGQWNPGTGFVSGTTVSFGTITIPPANGGAWASTLTNGPANNTYANFAYTFDLTSLSSNLVDPTYGYLTNPNSTYALLLTNTGSADGLALGLTNVDAFSSGYAYPTGFFDGSDWTFAQLVYVPGNVSLNSTPEPATVAAMCGLALVGALAILRRRQRQLALVAAA
jgi:hypothetical protein